MTDLYEALEICLKEIEQGADVDTVLFRHPDLADELRPLLETSVQAKRMAVPAPSREALRRNRAKLLQHAAGMREGKGKPVSRRVWSVPLRRAVVTLIVVVVLFAGGTGLVRASSSTLPGDNLYPVKRTWEDVLVFLTFNPQQRQTLELEHENERLDEVHELFAIGRSAKVEFAGYVTRQAATEWRVSGITIVISSDTRLPAQAVTVGAAVKVKGHAQSDGTVMADQIELLPANSKLPEINENESEIEQEDHEGPSQQIQENSSEGSGGDSSAPSATKTPKPESEPKDESFEGTVSSIKNNIVVINNIPMDISSAEVKGTPAVGATVKVEGYFAANGTFIVTKIEFKNAAVENDSNSNSDSGKDGSDNTNDNGNDNNNDNSNSSNSNDDHSGSGGGGDD